MGLPLIDIIVLAAYFVVITVIGLLSARKVSTQGDFYVGGRRFGKFLTMMTTFGAGTSNTHPILVAGVVYTYGMAGIWYSWLYMLFIPMAWIWEPLVRRLRLYTSADYFDLRYGKGLGVFFSVSALLNVGLIVGTMLLGMGQIVEGITDGALSKDIVVPLAALVIILYATAGGLLAAALTDVVQGILIIILSVMLLPPLFAAVGGLEGLHAAIPAEKFALTMPEGQDPSKSIGIFAIFILFVNGVMGNLAEPTSQLKQAVKNEWTLRIGGQIGGFMKRICTVGWALVGLCALVLWPNLEDPEMSFGLATRRFLPVGFSGLMIACMMAAAMSTCDTMMVCGSAIFTRNLYAKFINRSGTDKHYLLTARIVGVFLVLIGLGVSFLFSSVRGSVELWWKFTAFVGPTMLLGVFFRRGNRWGAWACMLASSAVWYLTQYNIIVPEADLRWDTIWYQASLYLPAGIIAYFVVSFLTPPEEGKRLDRFFARLNTPVGQEQVLIDAGLEPHPEEILPHYSDKKAKVENN